MTEATAATLPVNELELELEPGLPKPETPPEPGAPSFADHTRRVVDEVVENVCVEFSREVTTLRGQLDQFEQMLVTRASRTKGDMLSFVDLVKAGHDLTLQITTRLDDMRNEMDKLAGP